MMTLEELGKRLGPKAEQHLTRLQRAAFGREQDPVDTATLALEMVEIAQQRRHRRTTETIAGRLDYVLGEKVHLSAIDLQRPKSD